MVHRRVLVLMVLTISVLDPVSAAGGWNPGGTFIDSCDRGLIDPVMVSDGQSGIYVAWVDACDDSRWRAYCQRIDGNGDVLWPAGGVLVTETVSGVYGTQILTAGDGGVFVSWSKEGLYVQRLTSTGASVWPEPVPVTNAGLVYQKEQVLRPDGAGGLVIAFHEISVNLDDRIRAQRLDSSGTRLWGETGVTLSDAAGIQANPRMTVTTDGHYAIVWHDSHVYAQKVTAGGQILWPTNGVHLAPGGGVQRNPHVLEDEDGGCLVFWRDWRTPEPGLYGQRLDAEGLPQWAANGLSVDTYHDDYPDFDAITDDDGGAIVSWQIGNEDPNLYAQRLGPTGQKFWGAQPTLVVVADGGQKAPHLDRDGAGGAFLAWRDSRRGCEDIFAQHLSATGAFLWDEQGVTVAAFDGQQDYHDLIAAGPEDFIATWLGHKAPYYGLHAVRIGAAGSGITTECSPATAVPPAPSALRLLPNVPNPFNPRTTIHFELGEPGPTRIAVYDLAGRKVVQLLNAWTPEGRQSLVWDGKNERGEKVSSGIYLVRLQQFERVNVRKVALVR